MYNLASRLQLQLVSCSVFPELEFPGALSVCPGYRAAQHPLLITHTRSMQRKAPTEYWLMPHSEFSLFLKNELAGYCCYTLRLLKASWTLPKELICCLIPSGVASYKRVQVCGISSGYRGTTCTSTLLHNLTFLGETE